MCGDSLIGLYANLMDALSYAGWMNDNDEVRSANQSASRSANTSANPSAQHDAQQTAQSNAQQDAPRHYTNVDRWLIQLGAALATCAGKPQAARASPAVGDDAALTPGERRRAGRYMRVNHVGEVCAQALYQSQSMVARDGKLRAEMLQAADEENDHLAWCAQRLTELGARPSALTPLWYGGAFALGASAGLFGDKWNLGFIAETERQVVAHLESHLGELPPKDSRSRAIVAQMRDDENQHAESAVAAGARALPPPAKRLMRAAARVMTTTAHWI